MNSEKLLFLRTFDPLVLFRLAFRGMSGPALQFELYAYLRTAGRHQDQRRYGDAFDGRVARRPGGMARDTRPPSSPGGWTSSPAASGQNSGVPLVVVICVSRCRCRCIPQGVGSALGRPKRGGTGIADLHGVRFVVGVRGK